MRRLYRLVRVREIRERRAGAELGQAKGRLDEATALHAERRAALQSRRFAEDLRPSQLMALHLQGIRSGELLDEAAIGLAVSEHRLLEARQDWMTARTERESVEDLEQRQREAAAMRARLAGYRALDELMALRHRRGE
jgi:flagellar export protein FliJ